jgi:hypothetical protein
MRNSKKKEESNDYARVLFAIVVSLVIVSWGITSSYNQNIIHDVKTQAWNDGYEAAASSEYERGFDDCQYNVIKILQESLIPTETTPVPTSTPTPTLNPHFHCEIVFSRGRICCGLKEGETCKE